MTNSVYLGLGANLGDPVQQVIDARNLLGELAGVHSVRCSSLYLTSPIGYHKQRDFVNCVLELKGGFQLHELFKQTQHVELELGRVRDPNNQNAARKIDIDMLLFDSHSEQSAELTIPHPRMHQRLFVLVPLAELAPTLDIQGMGLVSDLIADGDFGDQQLVRLG